MTSKLTKYKFNRKLLEKNVPLELQEIDQWVVWAMESRDSDQKQTKIPKNSKTLRNAKTTSTDTWGSFEEACAACESHPELDGIGFVFTDNDPYVGIDLDGVVDRETGILDELANDFVSNIQSYTELSPSGTGLHIIMRGHLPRAGSRKGPVEMYEKGRYFTFTGKAISPQNSIATNQESLCNLKKKFIA
jgi:primase-polymerase (primpol)-like protein